MSEPDTAPAPAPVVVVQCGDRKVIVVIAPGFDPQRVCRKLHDFCRQEGFK